MTNHFTRVVDRKIAPCLLVAFVLPFGVQVGARADEPCPLEQKITPSDDEPLREYFHGGISGGIDTDGSVAIVRTDINNNRLSAYTLRFEGMGWAEGESLPAVNGIAAVAIYGDVALIGASSESLAYFYRFDGLTWNEEQVLDLAGGQSFGKAVALSSDWAVVTATGNQQSVYIFSHDGQEWVLSFDFSGAGGGFGGAVALSNDLVVVGAQGDDDNGEDAGAVSVYRFNGTNWENEATFHASDGDAGDFFGGSVAVSGDTVVVAALGDDDFGFNTGSVYVFEYDGIGWSECVKLNAPFEGAASFGASLAIDGDLLIIGAPATDIEDLNGAGAAFVYRREAGQWSNTDVLVASDVEAVSGFGIAVALASSYVLVGANYEDSEGDNAGAVYSYFLDESDCNNNGSPDSCDINSAVSLDCNANTVPDECDLVNFISVESGELSPIGDGFPQSLVLPTPSPAAATVTLTITAVGDFSSTSEWLDIDINGTYVGTVVGGIFDDCSMLPLVGEVLVDAEGFNFLVGDGDAAIGITASSEVDPFLCETSYVTVSVEYQPIDGDCNANSIPDECDIESGSSADCNSDGLPDECELVPRLIAASGPLSPIGAESPQSFVVEAAPVATSDVTISLEAVADLGASFEWIDVDVNGSFMGSVFVDTADDDCPLLPSVDDLVVAPEAFNDAVAGGDATVNLVPTADVDGDLCLESFISLVIEYNVEPLSPDCNANGILDECEADCNANTIPDDCDIDAGTSPDCNTNGVPDECDVESGSSDDCDSDGTPDECQLDCNENGVADPCDIAGGTSEDCAANGIPDECETDCNDNGTPDECDIAGGSSLDCNVNSIPDECEEDVCPGDVNADCVIDPLDSGFILARFGCSYPEDGENCLAADANGDGTVDPLDVGFVLARFGMCP